MPFYFINLLPKSLLYISILLVCMCLSVCVCMRVCINTCMCVWMYLRMIRMYAYMRVCTHRERARAQERERARESERERGREKRGKHTFANGAAALSGPPGHKLFD